MCGIQRKYRYPGYASWTRDGHQQSPFGGKRACLQRPLFAQNGGVLAVHSLPCIPDYTLLWNSRVFVESTGIRSLILFISDS